MNDKPIHKKVYADFIGDVCLGEIAEAWEKGFRYYIWLCKDKFSVGEIKEKDSYKDIAYRATFARKQDAIIFAKTLYCGKRYREMTAIQNELEEISSLMGTRG